MIISIIKRQTTLELARKCDAAGILIDNSTKRLECLLSVYKLIIVILDLRVD